MRSPTGPTARILALAANAPGGVIRWYEAKAAYLEGSATARAEEANARKGPTRRAKSLGGQWQISAHYPSLHYRSSLQKVLRKYFYKPCKGWYVAKDACVPSEEDGEEIEREAPVDMAA